MKQAASNALPRIGLAESIMDVLPPTMSVNYQTHVIRTLAEFNDLEPQWDEFAARCGVHSLCLTHHWMKTWISHFQPDSLSVIIVTDEAGNWQGVAPFQLNYCKKTGLFQRLLMQVQFIGTHPTLFDSMEMLILPESNGNDVIQEIASTLKKIRWDVLNLLFCASHWQLETLCAALDQSPSPRLIQETMTVPYVNLPDSVETFAKNRRKKTRLEVNRFTNKVVQAFGQAPELIYQEDAAACEPLLNEFIEGHIEYWKERTIKSDFSRYEQLGQFYKAMLKHGETLLDANAPRLQFSTFHFDNQVTSYQLGFLQANAYVSHVTHYSHEHSSYSPGTLHMDALVFDKVNKGVPCFEFGLGDIPYKRFWAEEKRPLWNLRLYRHPVAHLLWSTDTALKKLLKKGDL